MSELRNKPRIGVMGVGFRQPKSMKLAEKVGALIAERGGIVVCGGLGGVMEAAAKGAQKAGGITIGILPGHSAAAANQYIDIPIVTGVSHARNLINVLTSQSIIAIGSGMGTLSEIALALKCEVPVIGLETWNLDELGCSDPRFIRACSPEDAVRIAFEILDKEIM